MKASEFKQLIREEVRKVLAEGKAFTEADIKPGLKYKYWSYPGSWERGTVEAIKNGFVFTVGHRGNGELVDEFIEKINKGIGNKSRNFRLDFYKLIGPDGRTTISSMDQWEASKAQANQTKLKLK